LSNNDKDEKPNPLDLDPQAKAALMLITAAMGKSITDAQHYLALIMRKTIKEGEHRKEAEDVMTISQAMLDAVISKAGRGKIAIAALVLADVIVQDLIGDLFPELKAAIHKPDTKQ
jgi:hypothetical protein